MSSVTSKAETLPRPAAEGRPWWRGAVIYQIYPRSFNDTNGDGIGDLEGVTARLDYVAKLGVDVVWLSPFYRSPMKDFGYDIADFRAVDPMFGDLDSFDRMLARAHDLDLKVIIDQAVNHTSDQHQWFAESRAGRDNPKADWYVWSDPKPDGSPPNNWLSVFGGSAWRWEPRRAQYYLHNFLVEQPDLNLHNPEVLDAVIGELEFWLERGIDGFRLDTANYYAHDEALRDNPPRPADAPPLGGAGRANPYAMQSHLYDKSRPENFAVLKRLRALVDRYPDKFLLGEVSDDHSAQTAAAYSRGTAHLHTCYTFELLTDTYSASHFRASVGALEQVIEDGWPCWAFSNHDVTRTVSRWQRSAPSADQARMLNALLLSLRGTVCLYQGEELGLTQAEVPFDRMRDPFGLALYPEFLGRDGCRTPMPWQADAPFSGFSSREPWLPVSPQQAELAVDRQLPDPNSTLNACRRFLNWRRRHAALITGDIQFLDTPEPILAFKRSSSDETLYAFFNLGDAEARIGSDHLPPLGLNHEIGNAATISTAGLTLPAFGYTIGAPLS